VTDTRFQPSSMILPIWSRFRPRPEEAVSTRGFVRLKLLSVDDESKTARQISGWTSSAMSSRIDLPVVRDRLSND
jgi:hypothetical protein